MKQRYVLKSRTRFTLFLASILAVLATVVLASTVHGFRTPQYEKVIVQDGDSLWSIASQYKPDRDVRKYIYEIKKVNKLASSNILKGDTLLLPED